MGSIISPLYKCTRYLYVMNIVSAEDIRKGGPEYSVYVL